MNKAVCQSYFYTWVLWPLPTFSTCLQLVLGIILGDHLLSGTVLPACVLDTSQDGVFCLVTLDDECFHSCEQGTLAKELGLLEKAADPDCLCLNEERKRTGNPPGSVEAVLRKSNRANFCWYPQQRTGLETYQTIKLK